MKKRFTLLAAGVLCAVSIAAGAFAAGVIQEIKAELRPDFTVVIDGETKVFKSADGETVYPVLYEGTTYLPVRAIGEIMGKTVFWHENEKKIELKASTVTDADVIVGSDSAAAASGSGGSGKSTADISKQPAVDDTNFIGKEKAQEIALNKAGLSAGEVRFDRTELDKDNGVWHYEVEFKKNKVEYDADISAADGTILSWDVDCND